MYVAQINVITVNIIYDLGFRFYFEMGAFLFTSSLKTKNCFCKEMRFFLNNKKMPC